ncbi:MAG: methyltransferase [Chloroflexota bacterium]
MLKGDTAIVTLPQPAGAGSPFEEIIQNGPIPLRLPAAGALDQDQEWCEAEIDGVWRRIRFHDYDDLYNVPGLYETLFYRTLRCVSPTEVMALFRTILLEHGQAPEELSAIDFGAGNGMMGETLQAMGIRRIVGVDILPEAKQAALRDRSWVYDRYLVADMTHPTEAMRCTLEMAFPNTLVTVAALGYGDIPVRAFSNAFNLIGEPGWVAFNIKERFLHGADTTGFGGLFSEMLRRGILQVQAYKRYCHRLNIAGEPLYYVALVAKKLEDIPTTLIDQLEELSIR